MGLARKPEWRCLIPATGFAEAEGQKGKMTRTWISVKDQPIFVWAGLWRQSAEWGDVCGHDRLQRSDTPIHDRMPVLPMPDQYDRFLHGSFDDDLAFPRRCLPDNLIEMNRTTELWSERTPKADAASVDTLV